VIVGASERGAGPAWLAAGYVFDRGDGQPLEPDTFSKAVRKATRAIGLDGVRLHDLRHAFATMLVTNGTNVRTVADVLGRSTVAFTLSTYVHPDEGAAIEAIDAVERLLGGLGAAGANQGRIVSACQGWAFSAGSNRRPRHVWERHGTGGDGLMIRRSVVRSHTPHPHNHSSGPPSRGLPRQKPQESTQDPRDRETRGHRVREVARTYQRRCAAEMHRAGPRTRVGIRLAKDRAGMEKRVA
jgi:hypothetical protein